MTGGSKIRSNPIMMTMSPVGSPTSGENISDSSNINNNNNNYSSKLEQDRFLPIANVSRIMKRALPPNAKISKEAKETVQECVSEFISFITGEASDKCQREKRKTINGDDLLWAMTTLGFENYVSPLKIYLNNYRETEGEHTKSSSTIVQEDQHIHSPNRDTNTTTTHHHHHLHHHRGAPEIENFAINSGFYNNSITNIVTHNDAADANLRYRVQW